MTPPSLVIVSGPPASGKTTLALRLAAELRLPVIGRDDIKERLFDSLGWSDRAWSQRLGGASWEVLYWAIGTHLAAARSCIAESNFDPRRDSVKLAALCSRFSAIPIQIHCIADGHLLVERYLARVADGTRHPGHVDRVTIGEQRERLLAARPPPLAIDGPTLVVDTTDPARIDYDRIATEVRRAIGEP